MSRPGAKPMMAPVAPPSSWPRPISRPPSKASRTNVLNVFFTARRLPPVPGNRPAQALDNGARGSVVVAGMDVDAGHARGVEHVDVAPVVLERQPQVEAVGPKVGHGFLLVAPGCGVVARLPHHQQVPAQV